MDVEQRNRRLWVIKARELAGKLAATAYGMPATTLRDTLLHDRLEAIDEADEFEDVAALIEHANRTPYGFARYGGRLKNARLPSLPFVLDQCEDDAEVRA